MPVFVVDKPLNLTSHDVVHRARRALGTRRVGHTGTLDPLATGVLVVCSDAATKLVQFMEADSKDYLAWIALGAGTPTLDAEGPVTDEAHVAALADDDARAVLSGFVGSLKQVPPQYSALQVGGQRAYAVARAGGTLDLPARDVVIHDLRLIGVYASVQDAPSRFAPDADGSWVPSASGRTFHLPAALGSHRTLVVWARVGSGTYLRSLARDVGAALGVPAHLAGLVRTRVGRFGLQQAVSLDELGSARGCGELEALDLPVLSVDARTAKNLRDGKRPPYETAGRFVVVHDGQLVAVADGDGQVLRVVRAWA